MRYLALLAVVLLALTACPRQARQQTTPDNGSPQPRPVNPALSVALVCTDLGLGDGGYVRDADQALAELAEQGRLTYTPVGALPEALTVEMEYGDVGLPEAGSDQPGTMTLGEAEALFDDVPPCDLLVLSTPLLLEHVQARITMGELEAKAVLLLDEEGLTGYPVAFPVPLYTLRYEIKEIAFLLGVMVAESSNNGMFIFFASAADPQGAEFLDAAYAGARFHTNGAQVATGLVPVDATGLVTPETFRRSFAEINAQHGQYFTPNHYVVCVGRATPAIMYALTKDPYHGFVAGAYGDYRQIRPAYVLGCGLKKPGAALRYVLTEAGSLKALAALMPAGNITLGLEQDAVGLTSFEMYAARRDDADDIEEAATEVLNEIRVGELMVDDLIAKFSNDAG